MTETLQSLALCLYLGNDEMETRKTTALTTVVTGLRKFTNYSLQVLAFTKVGDGVHTATIYCQTDEDGRIPGRSPIIQLQQLFYSTWSTSRHQSCR